MDETANCPKCGRTIRLPPQLVIARESARAGGSFMGFTSSDTLPCPHCGFQIPIADLIRPKSTFGQAVGCLVAALILGAIAFGIYKWTGG